MNPLLTILLEELARDRTELRARQILEELEQLPRDDSEQKIGSPPVLLLSEHVARALDREGCRRRLQIGEHGTRIEPVVSPSGALSARWHFGLGSSVAGIYITKNSVVELMQLKLDFVRENSAGRLAFCLSENEVWRGAICLRARRGELSPDHFTEAQFGELWVYTPRPNDEGEECVIALCRAKLQNQFSCLENFCMAGELRL